MAIGVADAPRLDEEGSRKIVIATQADCGAEVYVWLIRTDDGEWLSEPCWLVPKGVEGLRGKKACIMPAQAERHPTADEAAEAAANAACIDWERLPLPVAGEADQVRNRVTAAIADWVAKQRGRGTGKTSCTASQAVSRETAAGEKPQNGKAKKASRAKAAKPLGQAQGRNKTAAIVPAGTPVELVPLDQIEVLPGNPEPDVEVLGQILAHGQDEPVILLAAGLLDCPPNVELTFGAQGNYLLLAGATRLTAARQAGQTAIEARVRRERLELADAIAFALRSNTGRRLVTTAEVAGRVKQLADCGLTDDQISGRLGINDREVNQLRRFGQLPTVWRKRVDRWERTRGDDEDSISWAAVKALLPYADVQPVLQDVELTWQSDWERPQMQTRDGFREEVSISVARRTRTVDSLPIDEVTNELRTQLDLRTLPTGPGGKKELRACCPRETLEQIIPAAAAKHRGVMTLDEPAAREPTPRVELTGRDLAAKHRADDAELKDRVQRNGGLREIGLRIACRESPLLKPGSEKARLVYRWLAACARDTAGSSQLDPATWITSAAKAWAKRKKVALPKIKGRQGYSGPDKEDYGRFLGGLADLDDSVTANDEIEVEFCQLVLWPQTPDVEDRDLYPPGTWPERIPWIDDWMVALIAKTLQAKIEDAWKLAQDNKCASAETWFCRFLAAHDRRQLTALAEECLVSGPGLGPLAQFGEAKKTEQMDACRVALSKGKFRLPKILQAKGKK